GASCILASWRCMALGVMAVLAVLGLAAAADMASMPGDWFQVRKPELPDARSEALGGVSVAVGSPFAFLANPALTVLEARWFNTALLPETRSRPFVGLSSRLGIIEEQRTRMVYDYYENAVGEMTIAENATYSDRIGPVAVRYPIAGLALGLGVVPDYDYRYHYRQELRDDFYQVIGIKELNLTGQVLRGNLTLAHDFRNLVGVGLGFNVLVGERTLDSTIRDTLRTITKDVPTGLQPAAGLLFHPGARVRVGLVLESRPLPLPGFLRKGDSYIVTLEEPPWLKLGINYFAPGPIPTGFFGQIGYGAWPRVDTLLQPVLEARAGVEHRLLDQLRLRYGFGLLPSPSRRSSVTGLVSLGMGFATRLVDIDVSTSLKRRVLGSQALVPVPSVNLRVYQTSWDLAVSVSRGF
ncbi:MAG: hypothetical protein ABIK62_04700, partial [candidate division WOR-3 bacterium]